MNSKLELMLNNIKDLRNPLEVITYFMDNKIDIFIVTTCNRYSINGVIEKIYDSKLLIRGNDKFSFINMPHIVSIEPTVF
jgi:hypothetical protein